MLILAPSSTSAIAQCIRHAWAIAAFARVAELALLLLARVGRAAFAPVFAGACCAGGEWQQEEEYYSHWNSRVVVLEAATAGVFMRRARRLGGAFRSTTE